ncbi:MAG TPA: hypothetical protein VN879_15945 [Candidatus Acidoferrales bacterium]|nr:hypothetical protein [Candidatus Acidoferrales bacterium]
MTDFAAKRISDADEWRIIRVAYAETYPVRLLLNHYDELAALLRRAAKAFPYDDGWLHEAQSLFDGSQADAGVKP